MTSTAEPVGIETFCIIFAERCELAEHFDRKSRLPAIFSILAVEVLERKSNASDVRQPLLAGPFATPLRARDHVEVFEPVAVVS